ncbi:MAG TPA: nitroreductase, partial [Actinomycetota bacterium]|nr:nitroreductase [Actinomycetota bacterium]
IGSCHSSVGKQDDARAVLGFPDDREAVILLSLGYPLRPLAPIEHPKRRPTAEIIHREHW